MAMWRRAVRLGLGLSLVVAVIAAGVAMPVAIAFVVLMAVAVAYMVVASRQGKLPIEYRMTLRTGHSSGEAMEAVGAAVGALDGTQVVEIRPADGLLVARRVSQWDTKGELVHSEIGTRNPGDTRITISSENERNRAVVDYGRNKRNVSRVAEALKESLHGDIYAEVD